MGNKSPSTPRPPDGITKINKSVWELHRGSNIPKVEIIFFHGLQLGDFRNAFWKTWQSRDGSVVWPKEWLGEKFPDARILSVSYDSSAIRNSKGKLDMYLLGESLVTNIILDDEHIGQNCPVVLVGHSLGGIVIKQFVLSAFRKRDAYNPEAHQPEIHKINIFLEQNVKGVFYYSTPHHDSRIADFIARIPRRSLYLELLKTLNAETQRINEEFLQQRSKLKAKAGGIGEDLPSWSWYPPWSATFSGVVVEEASARSDIDYYTTVMTDHFDVCKPDDKVTAIFVNLCSFIQDAAKIQILQAAPVSDLI